MKKRRLYGAISTVMVGGAVLGITSLGVSPSSTFASSRPAKQQMTTHDVVSVPTSAPQTNKRKSLVAAIQSVTFRGNSTDPTVTIKGLNLDPKPPVAPAGAPQQSFGCALASEPRSLARFGYDYGNSFYLQDESTSPTWSAGRYRPGSELDCVGMLVKRFTPSTIVFSLGSAYPTYPGVARHYRLRSGDRYSVVVNGVIFTGRVHYS
jgi:hypothetical protein